MCQSPCLQRLLNLILKVKFFEKHVAVAQQGMLNSKVLFSVPMNGSMANRVLLGTTSLLIKPESEVGQSGDTPDTQSSPKEDVVPNESTVGVVNAPQTVLSQAEETQINVVTRVGEWMTSLPEEMSNRIDIEQANLASLQEPDEPSVVSDNGASKSDSVVSGEVHDASVSGESIPDESFWVVL